MAFPVVMYRYKSWTIKKAEHQKVDAFQLWCWRRLLRVPWTAKGSSQSILKEINPEYSLEGLMLKLYLMLKFTWCWYWPPDANNQLIGKKPWIWRLMSTMVDDHHHHHSLCTRTQCFIAGLSPHIWLLAPWEKWWRVKWISSQQPNKMGTIGPLPTGL